MTITIGAVFDTKAVCAALRRSQGPSRLLLEQALDDEPA